MKSAFYQILAVALPIIFFVDLPAGSPSKPPDPSEQCVQKLVAIAMTLAQLQLIQEATGVSPSLLLDDPAAELDRDRLARFAEQIASLRCQLVVTALSADLDPLGTPDRVFHVEQGKAEPV